MEFFDKVWYSTQIDGHVKPDDMHSHYRQIGKFRNINPSPYFDTAWYVASSKIALESVDDPLEHFIAFGSSSLSDPHPLFNSKFYKWNWMNGDGHDSLPLHHYITKGWKKGARPHPLFWGDWYSRKYLSDNDGIDPFYHFITEGERHNFNPNPLFDVEWYRHRHGLSSGESPLTSYIYGGHEHRDPHPLFDSAYYRSVVSFSHLSPLEHYLTNRTGVDPCIPFDAHYFGEKYKEAFGYDAPDDVPPLVSYVEIAGINRINPHPLFSKKFYVTKYDDVKSSGKDPFLHYMSSGYAEGRQPHPLFEPDYYLEQRSDARGVNPLAHYLAMGARSNALPRRLVTPNVLEKKLPANRRVVNLSQSSAILDDTDPSIPSIGVFAHIFHLDLCDYIIKYTNNIPFQSTIYITTSSVSKAGVIEKIFGEISKHKYKIIVTPNRGRDIAPMLVGLREAFSDCDYALHIHTKKSMHYSSGFDKWRDYLFEMNLGSGDLIRKIIGLLSLPKIGAIAPDHYAPIKKLIQWGGNIDSINSLLWFSGVHVSPEHDLDFPSGSMFWFKTKALSRLMEIDLRYEHFDPELGQIDGTLAHAIERSLFYFVEMAGFEWLVHSQASEAIDLDSAALSNLHGNRLLPSDRELGVTRKYYPECTGYLVTPSSIERPRLNLMIPLIDQNKGYAGVATGINFFMRLCEALAGEFDARIISTDVSPSNQYAAPPGFELVDATDVDVSGRNTVIDGARRYRHPIQFRKNDIILATAWWTADGALSILKQQEDLFAASGYKFVYLIQDFECGFYPWSTKYSIADSTYRHAEKTVPVFNTEVLREFFIANGYFKTGFALKDGIARGIMGAIERGRDKEKIVLLYARPHAERNNLPFIDMLVSRLVEDDPRFWKDWRFLAIGEDFAPDQIRCTDRIEILGRLTLAEYGNLSSRAALAISLMVSPHPSYPPLELASAGVLVLTNNYANRDMRGWHDNIASFDAFDIVRVAAQLRSMADRWIDDPDIGWRGKSGIDWFFDGISNTDAVVRDVADSIRRITIVT